MLPKNQKKAIRSLVKGKTCKFCGRRLSFHVAAGNEGACSKALVVFNEAKKKFPHDSGACWLYYVKGTAKEGHKV